MHIKKLIPIINPHKANKETATQKKTYKHLGVPRRWYNPLSLLLSNESSLCIKVDEVITTINDINPDITAIPEAGK